MIPGTDMARATFRDGVGGVIALIVVGAIAWSALYDQSQSSQTALVGALGAVTGWLFRGAMPPVAGAGAATGNGNGAPPSAQ